MRVTALCFALLLAACPTESAPVDDDDIVSPFQFDEDFRWGSANATWQVEGDYDPDPLDEFPVRSNWTVWTERGCVEGGQTNPEGSGFYTRYDDDFALAAALGQNAVRVGVDWARIEPEDGVWNDAELQHTLDVLDAAWARGLEPILTLHHWVVPTWVQDPSGDEVEIDMLAADPGPDAPFVVAFEDFVRHVAAAVGERVDIYPILNETFSVITAGYLNGGCGAGAFPPGGFLDVSRARKVHANYLFAHAAACHALRELDVVDVDGDGVAVSCGAAASTNVVRPFDPGNPDDVDAAARVDWVYNHAFHVALRDGDIDLDFDGAFTSTTEDAPIPMDEGRYEELAGTLDWIGINYYGPVLVAGTGGGALGGVPYIDVADYDPSLPHSTLGFAIDPEGFYEVLRDFSDRYGLPLRVTENGVGDAEDDDRPRFLVEHVDAMARATEEGADVRGYYHWSLTDNFEWAHGRDQRFGLYAVDYENGLARVPGRSVEAYRAIAMQRGVTEAIRRAFASGPYPSLGGAR
jgi:beta-glucosidase